MAQAYPQVSFSPPSWWSWASGLFAKDYANDSVSARSALDLDTLCRLSEEPGKRRMLGLHRL